MGITTRVKGEVADKKPFNFALFWDKYGTFFILAIIVAIFGSMLKRVLETIPALDHVLGFVWGLAATAVSISIILAILNYQSFIDISGITGSSVIVKDLIEPLFPTLVGVVRNA